LFDRPTIAIVLAVWSTRWIVSGSWYRPRSVMPSLPSSRCRGDAREALLQIPDQILDGLGAYRQPHRPRPDAGRPQFVSLSWRCVVLAGG
jgi:hypothetical protein